MTSASSSSSGGPSSERTPTRSACPSGPAPRARPGRGTRRGRSCRRRRRARRRAPCRAAAPTIPAPLSIRTGGRISSTLRPQWALKPASSAASATSRDRGLGALLVGHAAPVQRGDRLLVLEPHAQPPQLLAEGLAGEALHAPRPGLQLAVELRARSRPGAGPPSRGSRGRRSSRARRSGARPTRGGPTRRRRRRSAWRPRSAAGASSRACARRRGAGRSARATPSTSSRTARVLGVAPRAAAAARRGWRWRRHGPSMPRDHEEETDDGDRRRVRAGPSAASTGWATGRASARCGASSTSRRSASTPWSCRPATRAGRTTTTARRSSTSSTAATVEFTLRRRATTRSPRLGPGGLARVDAATVRRFRNTSDTEEAVYLCVGGADGYVGRDGRGPVGDETRPRLDAPT